MNREEAAQTGAAAMQAANDDFETLINRPMATIARDPDTNSLKAGDLFETFALAKVIAASGFFPSAKGNGEQRVTQIALALEFGFECGMTLGQIIKNVMIVNGIPSIWGDAALALVMTRKDEEGKRIYEWDKHRFLELDDKGRCTNDTVCEHTIKRVGRDPVVEIYSVYDAITADLWGKGVWKNHPKRMLLSKPRIYNLRNVFPDVLLGMGFVEEQREIEEAAIRDEKAPSSEQDDELREMIKVRQETGKPVEVNGERTPEQSGDASDDGPTAGDVHQGGGEGAGETSADVPQADNGEEPAGDGGDGEGAGDDEGGVAVEAHDRGPEDSEGDEDPGSGDDAEAGATTCPGGCGALKPSDCTCEAGTLLPE